MYFGFRLKQMSECLNNREISLLACMHYYLKGSCLQDSGEKKIIKILRFLPEYVDQPFNK